MAGDIQDAIHRAIETLLSKQQPDGHWPGDNDGGVPTTAITALTEFCLGTLSDEDAQAYGNWLAAQQLSDGGFPAFPYSQTSAFMATALSWAFLQTRDRDSDPAQKAKAWLDANGGLDKADLPTTIWLAIAGAVDGKALKAQPMIAPLIPGIAGFLGKRMSYMTVIGLFLTPVMIAGLRDGPQSFHRWWRPIRLLVRWRLRRYLSKHQNPKGNWLGAQPFTVLALTALKLMGEQNDAEPMRAGIAYLSHWKRRGDTGLMALPFTAEVWNTSLITRLMLYTDPDTHRVAIDKGIAYLLSEQSTQNAPKDWLNAPPGMPHKGAWAFEADNALACDADTTGCVMATLALARQLDIPFDQEKLVQPEQWLAGLQNHSGGWPAFTHGLKDKKPGPMFTKPLPTPKGLIGALKMMLNPPVELGDPATADLTGRILETLAALGKDKHDPDVARAIDFTRSQLAPQGAWWGRWEVNYLLATAYVIDGLSAVGVGMEEAWFRTAVEWVKSHQNHDGGWGETAASYVDPARAGLGPSSAEITGSVVSMLLRTEGFSSSIERAQEYLLSCQREDGLWDETIAVGVLQPPQGFYTNFIYSQYAPVKALLDIQQHHT